MDKIPLPPRAHDDIADTSAAVAVKVAFGNASFVVMTLAYFVCGMQLVFITTHLPSYLAICGMDPMLSAETLGVIGGFNVLGSLFFGWAGERWNKLALLGGIYICAIAGAGLVFHAAAVAGDDAGVRRDDGISVARRRPAGGGRGRRDCSGCSGRQ